MPTGTYFIGAIADGPNTVVESDETNNALPGNQIAINPPDLLMTAVSGPATGCTGGTITVSNTYATHGYLYTWGFEEDDWFGVDVSVRLYLSTDNIITLSDYTIGSRASGGGADITSTADTPATIPVNFTPGQYYLGARADAYQNIVNCFPFGCPSGDTDMSNNVLTSSNQITIIGPDLVMTEVSGQAGASSGGTVTIHNTVATLGGGTYAFDVQFYLSTDNVITSSDRNLGRRTVPSLACGASNTADTTLAIPANLAPGTYYIGAIAMSRPNEINKANNSLAGNQIVITGPDLIMSTLSAPPGVMDAPITAATPMNQSAVASPGFSVGPPPPTVCPEISTLETGPEAPPASSAADTAVTISSYLGDDDEGYPIYLTGTYYVVAVADQTARSESPAKRITPRPAR
jgi:hypothetical protein